MGQPDQTEIRLLILDGLQKGARRPIQPMRYACQQAPAAFQQGSHLDRLQGHALEMSLEPGLEICRHTRCQHFPGRLRTARQIHEKGSPEVCIGPLIFQQQAHIEEITRMLP